MANVGDQAQRRRRRSGSGPPAALVITWALLSDPVLRSALEYATAKAQSAQHRARVERRELCLRCLILAILAGVIVRLVVWML